jgi:hypothetical protein
MLISQRLWADFGLLAGLFIVGVAEVALGLRQSMRFWREAWALCVLSQPTPYNAPFGFY